MYAQEAGETIPTEKPSLPCYWGPPAPEVTDLWMLKKLALHTVVEDQHEIKTPFFGCIIEVQDGLLRNIQVMEYHRKHLSIDFIVIPVHIVK